MDKDKSKKNKEDDALEKFKCRVQDLLKPSYDDFFLRKWLKAREFNVDKAEQMFRASMAFREKINADTILETYKPPEVLQKYLTGGFYGYDKDGSPVRVELYGHLDLKGIMASVKKSDLEKTKVQECETTIHEWKRQSEKLGKRVDGLTVIFDMEGVSTKMLWRPGLQMYLHLVKLMEDNYPEMMKMLLVINAPRIFPLLYKLARPLISEDMKNKIHVLSGNYQETLLKYIGVDQLPAFLGGTGTDSVGDPRCGAHIGQGGDVPEEFYLHNDSELVEHMKTVQVRAGDKLCVDCEVEQPGSVLRWEFKTDNHDIGFGVFLKQSDDTRVAVLPVQRVNSHAVAEDGSVTCDEAGKYYLCFDNSYSWARAKRISYITEVIYTDDSIKSEINTLIEQGDWDTLADKFETTHL